MPNSEKIIKGLKEAEIMLTKAVDRNGEMSVIVAFYCLNRVTNALAMLKEQEAKTPVECVHDHYWYYTCPTCGTHEELFREWNYCPFCGQAVKWE